MSGVREAHAADVNPATLHRVLTTDLGTQDTTPKKKPDTTAAKPVQDTSTKKKPDTSKAAPAPDTSARKSPSPSTQVPSALQTPQVPAMPAVVGGTAAVAPPTSQQGAAGTAGLTQEQIAARAAYELMHPPVAPPAATPAAGPQPSSANSRAVEEKFLLERSQHQRDRYKIEINKKFSLAAACLIFCIVAPPIALRFPRGGIGLVIGVSLVVFAMYYVGLIGGEAAANNGLVDPFWAMWGTNAIMTLVGMVLMLRMRRDAGSRGGGGLRDWLEQRRFLRDERRAAAKRVSA